MDLPPLSPFSTFFVTGCSAAPPAWESESEPVLEATSMQEKFCTLVGQDLWEALEHDDQTACCAPRPAAYDASMPNPDLGC